MRLEIDVFFADTPLTDKDALERYDACCSGPTSNGDTESAPPLATFMAELTDRYPRLETLPEAEREDSPWSGDISETNGHALLAMSGSHCADAVEYIMELADKHGLVCFDPKTRSILTAPPGMHLEGRSGSAIWPLTAMTLLLALAGVLLLH